MLLDKLTRQRQSLKLQDLTIVVTAIRDHVAFRNRTFPSFDKVRDGCISKGFFKTYGSIRGSRHVCAGIFFWVLYSLWWDLFWSFNLNQFEPVWRSFNQFGHVLTLPPTINNTLERSKPLSSLKTYFQLISQEWGFSRLQIKGVKFFAVCRNFLPSWKNFLKSIWWFFQNAL